MTKPIEERDIGTYYFSDTSFNLLMQNRIRRVLVICSSYDFFMIEEDGRIDEQIFNEYVSLNLRYPPVFVHADSARKAFSILENDKIDLIIEMLSIDDVNTFDLAKQVKAKYTHIPIVVLTHFSREVSLKLENEDTSAIDYVFSWLGNADLLLAIIKLIEDKMNAPFDIGEVGVQCILFVEDSVRFISSYLPNLYKVILYQSLDIMKEALNEHQKMLRRRGRPKILLAKNYEEAFAIYKKYKSNILGIISDISYKVTADKNDVKTKAGLELCRVVKSEDANIPFLLQSSDISYKEEANRLGAGFLHKFSKNLSIELRDYVISNFGFGDFIFRDPKTLEKKYVAPDLKTLQELILKIPDDVFVYHTSRDDLSKWLNARALFPIAQIFKPTKLTDFKNLNDARKYIYNAISNYRSSKAKGVIAEFNKKTFDEYLGFSRIGEGSIGGKARGLAFMNTILIRQNLQDSFNNVIISVPRTVVLGTEVFDEFMEHNDLYKTAFSALEDHEIFSRFLAARIPPYVTEDIASIVSIAKNPVAVRSSSKLEDSFFQPFAGIYNTYMVPMSSSKAMSLKMLEDAIKCVYASVYFKASKAYMLATTNALDEEKMGIIIQEVCGERYGNRFYPAVSGVARSVNYYPVHPEKAGDGIATIAYGLGKLIAEGGVALRFSPKYPKKLMQLSSPENALKNTQHYFYSVDLDPEKFIPSADDKVNLLKLKIADAENDHALRYAASVYDMENNLIRDGIDFSGKKIITFSNVLQHGTFPLAEITDMLLQTGQKELNNPVEIEFAVNLDKPPGHPKIFNLLQLRPIVAHHQEINFKIGKVDIDKTIIYSEKAMGNGRFRNISHIVYVKPETFHASKSLLIVKEIEELNSFLQLAKENYVLIGSGRWGSSDPWLGIPVKWAQISAARIIVESGLEDYSIDPSQGTHFFHNLTSFGVGYFTISPHTNDGHYNTGYLNQIKAVKETEFLRLVKFNNPLKIEVDGRNNKGVVYKPELNQL
ncbi:MAG: phosphoenolpyruvate synthase [Bacteroidales bacterium]|nr:phosphoenolpyruvate synthase [Bacteroidales bacterium]